MNEQNNFSEQNSVYLEIIKNFEMIGEKIYDGDRNTLKKITTQNGKTLVVKAFKKPNFINQWVYGRFRQSKAKRSFYNAKKLIEIGLNTPKPLFYWEEKEDFLLPNLLFAKSYYFCEFLDYDFTIREILDEKNQENREIVLQEYAKTMFALHQKHITFTDNTPGNFLIKLENNSCKIYLVDLNRMIFKKPSKVEKIKNLAKITDQKEFMDEICKNYAQLNHWEVEKTQNEVWQEVQIFQNRLKRKKQIKNWFRFGR